LSYRSYYKKGDWLAICDVCGRKYKASTLRKRWDGLMTCQQDWEPRQPQDFVRGVAEHVAPPWTKPESEPDVFFTNPYYCASPSALPNIAIPNCMIPNNTSTLTAAEVFGTVPQGTFTEP
jgi:hypothetical protein